MQCDSSNLRYLEPWIDFQISSSILRIWSCDSGNEYATRSGRWSLSKRRKGKKFLVLPYARHGLVSAYHAARLPPRIDSSPPLSEKKRTVSRGHRRERRTWRKNPPDVTLARHPVFQSGIDKKSLPESQRGNNYARNIMARSREPRAARIASAPRFPARVRVTRKFFPRMIYRDEGGSRVFHFPSSVPLFSRPHSLALWIPWS